MQPQSSVLPQEEQNHISICLSSLQSPRPQLRLEEGGLLLTELQVKAGNADCEELVFSLS